MKITGSIGSPAEQDASVVGAEEVVLVTVGELSFVDGDDTAGGGGGGESKVKS